MRKKKQLLLGVEDIDTLGNIKAIEYIINKMKPMMLELSINEKSIDFVLAKIKKIEDEAVIAEVKKFFMEIYTNEWEKVREASNFIPAIAWENYKKLYNEKNMPEQKHLNECRTKLRKKWVARPEVIKKSKPRKKKITE